MHDPKEILRQLSTQPLVPLSQLPALHGIYALADHAGIIRYIGVTKSERMGFHNRIHNYHVRGSIGRSHKYSHAYNSGRMFSPRKDTSSTARAARDLKAAFCRARCKAAYVAIDRSAVPGDYFTYLRRLESAVQALAPSHMRDWEGLNFKSLPEPKDALDAFLGES